MIGEGRTGYVIREVVEGNPSQAGNSEVQVGGSRCALDGPGLPVRTVRSFASAVYVLNLLPLYPIASIRVDSIIIMIRGGDDAAGCWCSCAFVVYGDYSLWWVAAGGVCLPSQGWPKGRLCRFAGDIMETR